MTRIDLSNPAIGTTVTFDAVEVIEELRDQLAQIHFWGRDFFGPDRWQHPTDLASENGPAPSQFLPAATDDDIFEYGTATIDIWTGDVHSVSPQPSIAVATSEAADASRLHELTSDTDVDTVIVRRPRGGDWAQYSEIRRA